jgi:hypothetical protein
MSDRSLYIKLFALLSAIFLWGCTTMAGPLSPAPEPPSSPRIQEMCNDFAKKSVAQNEENLRRRCGFIGPQWSPDYGAHFRFCTTVPWEQAISVEKDRETDLRDRCRGY